jgi:transcriptional regulator with XRE-family HTH domain
MAYPVGDDPVPPNRINEVRRTRKMKIKELAKKADLSAPYVSQMALGIRNISLKNLEKLAAALNCRPEDLLGSGEVTNNDVLNVWATIPADRRELALQVLTCFASNTDADADE